MQIIKQREFRQGTNVATTDDEAEPAFVNLEGGAERTLRSRLISRR